MFEGYVVFLCVCLFCVCYLYIVKFDGGVGQIEMMLIEVIVVQCCFYVDVVVYIQFCYFGIGIVFQQLGSVMVDVFIGVECGIVVQVVGVMEQLYLW